MTQQSASQHHRDELAPVSARVQKLRAFLDDLPPVTPGPDVLDQINIQNARTIDFIHGQLKGKCSCHKDGSWSVTLASIKASSAAGILQAARQWIIRARGEV